MTQILELSTLLQAADPRFSKSLRPKKAATLAAPLPRIQQAKLNREAATEVAHQEVSKWNDLVKQNREAEHLIFPVNPKVTEGHSTASLIASFQPMNAFENQINDLLQPSATDEKSISAFETQQLSLLPPSEVKKRQDALRLQRDLMFSEEKRAKRIAKIKSKSYRRVHRKRIHEDAVDDEEAERIRAKERMTLRHKNTGKWAKKMKGRKDEGVQQMISEQLRRGEELRRKIRGIEDNESDDFTEEEAIERVMEEPQEVEGLEWKSGIMGMKFIQTAMMLRKRKNDEEISGFEPEIVKEQLPGRRKFTGPNGNIEESESRMTTADADEEEWTGINEMNLKTTKAFLFKYNTDFPDGILSPGANPWIMQLENSSNVQNTSPNPWLSHENQISIKTSSKNIPSKHQKLLSQSREDDAHLSEDEVEINLDDHLQITHSKDLSIQQRDLVKRAFAGDDVVRDFDSEKKAVQGEEGDQEIDETLAGWGLWTGKGIKNMKKRKIVKVIPGINKSKRKDRKLKNVIINEKRVAKNTKYTTPSIPYPYETREQYHRAMGIPLGAEWNTLEFGQRMRMPRIVVKEGGRVVSGLE
ncbi:U3 small nucleolar RNA-associated protein 14 [Neolecta irregularis DAH-3]|uniref:U3 small nucleolar RNA-associated protein 14 n=1 Tax=Neolecta irregularis (strain DAH-3) TaxID=1198029 RepID=A0A1U7LSM5_NEOID|nr:U3 small nucleolar RNA-associated protein 14 [Neolecta irregularis DAH-3]|eukprot:OLL25521.1 U3 small nucleolar RNA-associated protein 14 [Neolecta irregularis DAH-3]